MGVKGVFCSPNGGGGVICCPLSIYQPAYINSGTLRSPPALCKVERASKVGEIGQKLIFICSVLSNLGKIGDNKRQNTNIFLKCGCKVGAVQVWSSACLSSSCPLVAGGQGFGLRTYRMLAVVLWPCVPSLLSALLLFPWCIACKYGSISRF